MRLNIKLVKESPAPWVMNKRKIYQYSFQSNKAIKSNTKNLIQATIRKTIGADNINKYKYQVCAVLNRDKRAYANTQFQNFNDVDIEPVIQFYLDEYGMKHELEPSFKDFYVFVIKNYEPLKGGAGDKNDCLFDCISQAFNFDPPKDINKAFKLKRILGLERNDTVHIDKLKILEEQLNCSFEVVGDTDYKSSVSKVKNIKMTLKNGHYSFIPNTKLNVVNNCKFKNADKIYSYTYAEENVVYYDGTEQHTISRTEFDKLRNDFDTLLVYVKPTEDLKKHRDEYLDKAEYFYSKYGEMINFYKSSNFSSLNYKNILLRFQGIETPEEIDEFEGFVIDRGFRGGIRCHQKGTFENVFDYDINSMYSHFLTNSHFTFPMKKPEYKHISQDEFENLKFYPYGYYHCKPEGSHKLYTYKNDYDWFSHYDLEIFKLLDIKVSMSSKDTNHLYYSSKTRLNGNILKDYVEKLYNMRGEVDEKYELNVKLFLSSIYGCLCEKNKKTQYGSKEHPVDTGDDFISEVQPTHKGITIETVDTRKIFKHDYARISFITAYCRLKMIQTLLKHCDLEKLVAVNTDGFATTEEIKTLTISPKIGDWKVKKYKEFTIQHLNSITKVSFFVSLVRRYYSYRIRR